LRLDELISIIYDSFRSLEFNMTSARLFLVSLLFVLLAACGGGGGGGGASGGTPVGGGNPPPPPAEPDPFLGQGPIDDVLAQYGGEVGLQKSSRPMPFTGNRRYAGKVTDFTGPFHVTGSNGGLTFGCASTDNDCLDGIALDETVQVVSNEPALIEIPFNDLPGEYRLFLSLDENGNSGSVVVTRTVEIESANLQSGDEPDREYRRSVVLPAGYDDSTDHYPVVYMHDGQWLGAERVPETLEWLVSQGLMPQIIVVAIHATRDRGQEYGVASTTCPCGGQTLGSRASRFHRFLINDLMPDIEAKYRVLTGPENTSVMGFSLGGLSATDVGWRREDLFGTIGGFSSSFWYYSDETNRNGSRAMLQLIRNGELHPGQRFWFEAGTNDTNSDRDGDGVNDMIDDTLDIVAELQNKGYEFGSEVAYFEVEGGYHNNETIAYALPHFFEWAYAQ
jgi:predicted alpha/beta superfamily hydrolase